MTFLAKLLRGFAFIPAIVHGIEALFGARTGAEKRESALSFISAAIALGESVTNRDIVDEANSAKVFPRSSTAWCSA
jgi:hypothetical protein